MPQDLEQARGIYRAIRDLWLAGGGGLEAHDRLALLTVAAGMRPFAFLSYMSHEEQPAILDKLLSLGLTASPCSVVFDIEISPEGISRATVEAYTRAERQRSPLKGIGVWKEPGKSCGRFGMGSFGQELQYPRCCEAMEVGTKRRDHELFLTAIVEAEGDDAAIVEQARLERREYEKASYDHCREWNERFYETLSQYPFVLHAACGTCLRSKESPTAILNRRYEELALAISDELHLMVRWGAQALLRSRDRD
ncbi:MAG TPA: hypothetical protein VGG72_11800 [Bryobacteraceae bacterium]|jgi:hypothetical protein